MEQEKIDWFGIEDNASAYATVKQFQALEKQRDEYKFMYETRNRG